MASTKSSFPVALNDVKSLFDGRVLVHAASDVVGDLGQVVIAKTGRGAVDAVDADAVLPELLEFELLVVLESAMETCIPFEPDERHDTCGIWA